MDMYCIIMFYSRMEGDNRKGFKLLGGVFRSGVQVVVYNTFGM